MVKWALENWCIESIQYLRLLRFHGRVTALIISPGDSACGSDASDISDPTVF